MHNRVQLIGHMATDPQLRYTQVEGIPVASFRIAVDRPRRTGKEPTTDFFDVVLWRQDATFAANYMEKGRLVFLEGHLQNREFVDKDEIRRRVTEVHALEFKALDRPKSEGPSVPNGGTPPVGPIPPGGDTDGDVPVSAPEPDPTDAFAG